MTLRAQVTLNHDSGLAADRITNTFHFVTADPLGQSPSIATALTNFYTATQTVGASIQSYLTQRLSGTGEIKIYDLTDPEPRVPVYTTALALTITAGAQFPGNVSYVLSFQGVKVSGLPQSRRRGRIYLGPLKVGAGDTSTTNVDQRPNATFMTTCTQAMKALQVASAGAGGWDWVVHSQAAEGTAWTDATVVDGWVDNRFDTMRSRQEAATARQLWS